MRLYSTLFIVVCLNAVVCGQEFDFLNYSEKEQEQSVKERTFKTALLDEIDSSVLKSTDNTGNVNTPFVKKESINNQVDYSLSVGSMIGVANKDLYYTSSYIAPNAKINLSEKLYVNAGLGYSFSRTQDYFLFNSENPKTGDMININSVFAYGSAVYSLGQRTSLLASGTVDYQMYYNDKGQLLDQANTNVSLGINYEVTPGFSINAQINYGNYPDYSTFFNPHGVQFNPRVGF